MDFDGLNISGYTGERCVLAVDGDALLHNAEYIVKKTGKKLIAVVKANAYGHGIRECVKTLSGIARLFAVATSDEAGEVIACGARPLVLYPLSGAEMQKLEGTHAAVAVSGEAEAKEAVKHGLSVHVAVDTGMHRYGADWHDVGLLLRICDTQGIKTEGFFTHFACADCEDTDLTYTQMQRFDRVSGVLGKRRFEYIHCANSAAALRFVPSGNAIRTGLALYGVNPDFCGAPLKEVSRLYAKVLCIRLLQDGESIGYGGAYTASGIKRIAVIGAGYGDGVPYQYKKCGSVSVNGFICPLVGNVCMDCAFADVTHARVQEGDYVCVIGGEGECGYRAAARKTGNIPYGIMTGISARVKRLYLS